MKIKKYLLASASLTMLLLITGADFEHHGNQSMVEESTKEAEHDEIENTEIKNTELENAKVENKDTKNIETENAKIKNSEQKDNDAKNLNSEQNEYAFFAETKEKALETAVLYSAKLLSYSNGIGVLALNENAISSNEVFSVNSNKLPVLYPEYLYTVELEDENINDNEEIQWHMQTTKAEAVWDMTKGKGVRVAVVDTGADLEHNDLKEGIVVADTSIPESEYGEDGRFLSSYMGAQDYFGHGTHVIGIVGARDNGFGCKGIAPECEIISIKSLEKEGSRGIGKTSWVVAGIQKAIENNANVINLSLGGTSVKDEMLQKVIQEATQKGIVVVCAAGNISGTPKIFYPGAYEETIAVSGLMKKGESIEFASSYSNYGDWIDISAPGSAIMSTIIGGYGTKTGTSMASPIVAASVALLIAKDSTLTNDDILHLLYSSANDMGDEGKDDKYGYGSIDIEKMFNLYKEEYIVPNPIAKIPDKSIVGEGTAIMIEVPQNAQKVVYTLDGTEPAADSSQFPADGLMFDSKTGEITINARSIMANGRIGKVVTLTYTIVKKVTETESGQKLENEVIPQYGAYLDPVLKLPCRRYKITVEPKHSLTVSVSSDKVENIGLQLFDTADEKGKALVKEEDKNNKGIIKWKNTAKEPVQVWVSITKKETVDADSVLTYSILLKSEKTNKKNTQSNNDKEDNSDKSEDSKTQVQQTQKTQADETHKEEFIYEDDWLYTMTEVNESQETISAEANVQNSEAAINGNVSKDSSKANNKSNNKDNDTDINQSEVVESETISEQTAQNSSSEDNYSYLSNISDDDEGKQNNRSQGYGIYIFAFIVILATIIAFLAINIYFSKNEDDN